MVTLKDERLNASEMSETNVSTDQEASARIILEKFENCSDLVVASVGNVEKEAFLAFENQLKIHFLTHRDVFPFQNKIWFSTF